MSRKSLVELIQNASQQKPSMAKKFVSDYIYTVEHIEGDYTPSKSFKPSSIKCIRNGVYQCLGVPPDKMERTSQTLTEICRVGRDTHLAIQETVCKMAGFGWVYEDVGEYVKKKNLDLEVMEPSDFEKGIYETKLYSPKYNVRFLCDGLLSYKTKDMRTPQYMIFEIKTCGSSKFYSLTDVLDEHKQQAVAYCVLLGIDKVLFFYSDRNMLGKKAYIFTPSKKDKQALIDKLEYGNECVKKGIVPRRPAEASNKYCSYCFFLDRCDKDGANEFVYEPS